MDMLGVYSAMRRDILAIRSQADRISARIAANTVTASDLHDGLRTNGFEVWFTRLSVLWDASDASVDLTTQDYTFPSAKLTQWGVDPVALTAGLTERSRAKLIGFWRADKLDAGYSPAADLAALRTSMAAARNFVATNYPIGAGGLDEGIAIDADGERITKVFSAGEMTALGPLLDDTSAKCAPLLA